MIRPLFQRPQAGQLLFQAPLRALPTTFVMSFPASLPNKQLPFSRSYGSEKPQRKLIGIGSRLILQLIQVFSDLFQPLIHSADGKRPNFLYQYLIVANSMHRFEHFIFYS